MSHTEDLANAYRAHIAADTYNLAVSSNLAESSNQHSFLHYVYHSQEKRTHLYFSHSEGSVPHSNFNEGNFPLTQSAQKFSCKWDQESRISYERENESQSERKDSRGDVDPLSLESPSYLRYSQTGDRDWDLRMNGMIGTKRIASTKQRDDEIEEQERNQSIYEICRCSPLYHKSSDRNPESEEKGMSAKAIAIAG